MFGKTLPVWTCNIHFTLLKTKNHASNEALKILTACQNNVGEALTPCCMLYNDISQNSIIKYGTAIGASCVGAYCTKHYHSFIASVVPETHNNIQSVRW
jgi:hypothetical protein